ncbi:MAG TPA: hypothetical protein VFA18_18010 [Gemmataceae bacterium]|nr:hypothetical protein [Gemmataceae bacterium]
MGVSLYYTSLEPVPLPVAEAILAELRQSAGSQPWLLCEPPDFFPQEEDGKLRGGSKLNLHPWADEMEEAAAIPAERNDLEQLARLLCDWSGRHGITWELSVDGERLGRIVDGVCQGDVLGMLEAFADVAQYLGEEYPREEIFHLQDDTTNSPPNPGLRIWPGPESE